MNKINDESKDIFKITSRTTIRNNKDILINPKSKEDNHTYLYTELIKNTIFKFNPGNKIDDDTNKPNGLCNNYFYNYLSEVHHKPREKKQLSFGNLDNKDFTKDNEKIIKINNIDTLTINDEFNSNECLFNSKHDFNGEFNIITFTTLDKNTISDENEKIQNIVITYGKLSVIIYDYYNKLGKRKLFVYDKREINNAKIELNQLTKKMPYTYSISEDSVFIAVIPKKRINKIIKFAKNDDTFIKQYNTLLYKQYGLVFKNEDKIKIGLKQQYEHAKELGKNTDIIYNNDYKYFVINKKLNIIRTGKIGKIDTTFTTIENSEKNYNITFYEYYKNESIDTAGVIKENIYYNEIQINLISNDDKPPTIKFVFSDKNESYILEEDASGTKLNVDSITKPKIITKSTIVFNHDMIFATNNDGITNDNYQQNNYSLINKYVVLLNNATYASAIVQFIKMFPLEINFAEKKYELNFVREVDDTGNLYNKLLLDYLHKTDDINDVTPFEIKTICNINSNGVDNTGCEKEYNIIDLMNYLVLMFNKGSNPIFGYKASKNVVYNINGKLHSVYKVKNGETEYKLINGSDKVVTLVDLYTMKISGESKTIYNLEYDILNKYGVNKYDVSLNSKYYYKNENNNYELITSDKYSNIIEGYTQITDIIGNYFVLALDSFKGTTTQLTANYTTIKDLMQVLIVGKFLLVPMQIIFFNGNNIDSGKLKDGSPYHYVSMEYINKEWLIYEHYKQKVIQLEDYDELNELVPLIILYKKLHSLDTENNVDLFALKDSDIDNGALNMLYKYTYAREKALFNYLKEQKDMKDTISSIKSFANNDNDYMKDLINNYFYNLGKSSTDLLREKHTADFIDDTIANMDLYKLSGDAFIKE